MSSQYEIDNKKIVFTKGAVDVLINKIKGISLNGKVKDIKESDIENILETNYNFSKNGYLCTLNSIICITNFHQNK